MYEVEVKVRADHGAVLDRIHEVDATPVGTVRQIDTYYDAPDRNFVETDEAVRVRREIPIEAGETEPAAKAEGTSIPADERTVLTYKGPKVDAASKTRAEAETAVADADGLRAVLDGMGYEAAATVEKRRELYRVGESLISLDDLDPVGEFVEVEREVEVQDGNGDDHAAVESARDEVFDLLRDLNLDPSEQIRTSYLELVLDAEE